VVRSKNSMIFNHINQMVKDRWINLELLVETVNVVIEGPCKDNLTNLRRILHSSLAKGNPK
jgi:hypothetical protein